MNMTGSEHLAVIKVVGVGGGGTNAVNRMVSEMAAAQGVNEALKERDPMAWVGAMNSLKAQAEEIVLSELVYA